MDKPGKQALPGQSGIAGKKFPDPGNDFLLVAGAPGVKGIGWRENAVKRLPLGEKFAILKGPFQKFPRGCGLEMVLGNQRSKLFFLFACHILLPRFPNGT